jgi:hypothetical protein
MFSFWYRWLYLWQDKLSAAETTWSHENLKISEHGRKDCWNFQKFWILHDFM